MFEGVAISNCLFLDPLTARERFWSLAEALRYGHGALVEPFVLGREVTVGVLDRHGENPVATPAIEIRTAAEEWYDYENRYTPGKSEHLIPAPLPQPRSSPPRRSCAPRAAR